MQIVHILAHGNIHTVRLPRSDAEILPGVIWGDTDQPLTPAWWARRAYWCVLGGVPAPQLSPLTRTLAEDVVYCLLGGHGIRAEVAHAAFARLRGEGLFQEPLDEKAIEELLRCPLEIDGRSIRYRFPTNRARYIATSLDALRQSRPPTADLELRQYLLNLRGIGPKTASWIVRNHLGSDQVAIIDVHVFRACRIAGVFPEHFVPSKNYGALERLFLKFSEAVGVRPSMFDLLIWDRMRRFFRPSRAA
jgi:thermostable 8-oxoguanine DNA glycosylase